MHVSVLLSLTQNQSLHIFNTSPIVVFPEHVVKRFGGPSTLRSSFVGLRSVSGNHNLSTNLH